MAKYIDAQTRAKRMKVRRARRFATYACIAVFVLSISLVVVKVIEHFGAKNDKPLLLDSSGTDQTTDMGEQTKKGYEGIIGPMAEALGAELILPDMTTIQVTENGRVDLSYFDDAVFIGDSLADGFREYKAATGLTNSTYLTAKSTTPRSFTQGGFIKIKDSDEPVHAFNTIEQLNPKKVYVTLGTNALMAMEPAEFMETYYEFIRVLKEKAPNAVIYVTSITPTTATTSAAEPRLEVNRIYQTNCLIAKMCNEQGLAFLNVYDIFKNDSGYLKDEIAYNEGIHLKPSGYKMWVEYLISHTVYSPDSQYILGSPYFLIG
ncbi:MAG: GDSL-type esterase/lipase family protein [Oscillospiraceae bacterium]